jgi:hypothetical protein
MWVCMKDTYTRVHSILCACVRAHINTPTHLSWRFSSVCCVQSETAPASDWLIHFPIVCAIILLRSMSYEEEDTCSISLEPLAARCTWILVLSTFISSCSVSSCCLSASFCCCTFSNSAWYVCMYVRVSPPACAFDPVPVPELISCLYVCINPLTFENKFPLRCIHSSVCAKVHRQACRHALHDLDSSRIQPLAWQICVFVRGKCESLRVHIRATWSFASRAIAEVMSMEIRANLLSNARANCAFSSISLFTWASMV